MVAMRPEEWREIGYALALSPRELEIAQALCAGVPAVAIGRQLGITINTIHTHMTRMHYKLKVRSSTGIVARIFEAFVEMSRGPALQGWATSATG